MNRKVVRLIALGSFALVVALSTAWQALAQDTQTAYPRMAPLEQYLIADPDAETAMARSAAPESISRDADVVVLGRQGYETTNKGKNGFVCLVQRSWIAPFDDPEFWNPKGRAPICLNPAAVRTFLPVIIKRTELVLAGQSKTQMFENLKAAVDKKELPAMETGAMGYMMSKQTYNDRNGHWRPHLMFFVPLTDPALWGADLPGSPILAFSGRDSPERLTVFLIPLGQWSDGAAAPVR